MPKGEGTSIAAEEKSRMCQLAEKTPVPMSGLMLGIASSGNMVPDLKWLFGPIAAVILLMLVIKIAYDKNLRNELKNPAVAGIAATFPMAVAILSTYLKPYAPDLAFLLWVSMMILHIALMVYFTWAFMFKFDLKKCLPCYFVIYVGFTVNAIVAPVFGQILLGQIIFWFGLISYLVLLPPLLYRVVKIGGIPDPLFPTVAIFAAPASLCLVGYYKVYASPENWMVALLLTLSLASYVAVLFLLPRIFRKGFCPAYSALTFPLVISAIATNASYLYLSQTYSNVQVLQYLAWFETALALVIIAFVLVRYTMHFTVKKKTKA
jgi:exfoliative toxin A/B